MFFVCSWSSSSPGLCSPSSKRLSCPERSKPSLSPVFICRTFCDRESGAAPLHPLNIHHDVNQEDNASISLSENYMCHISIVRSDGHQRSHLFLLFVEKNALSQVYFRRQISTPRSDFVFCFIQLILETEHVYVTCTAAATARPIHSRRDMCEPSSRINAVGRGTPGG